MAVIYCFTSTGNSLYTARKIAKMIDADVLPMKESEIECRDNVIGFVFPTYFWGLPRIVSRFIDNIQIRDKGAYIFAVVTGGGPTPGVLVLLKKLMKAKGIELQYGAKLISVTNYLPEYEVNDSEVFRHKIDKNILKIGDSIKRGKSNFIVGTVVLNKLIYKHYPDEKSDRFFTVAESCVGCLTCQKVCPVNNILFESKKPDFRHKCEHCLACLHNCPIQSIEWKEKTQGKKRYRNAAISLEDLILFNLQKTD